jgi:cell division protease FtsH
MADEKREIAVHEAAHAVIARILGITCGEVTIVSEEGYSVGHSVMNDPRFSWERGDGSKAKAADNFAVALFAGAEAERLMFNSQTEGDSVDRERATDCLSWAGAVKNARFAGDEHFDRHEANLRRRAADLVRRYRPHIEKLAGALVERGTLTGPEADTLCWSG